MYTHLIREIIQRSVFIIETNTLRGLLMRFMLVLPSLNFFQANTMRF